MSMYVYERVSDCFVYFCMIHCYPSLPSLQRRRTLTLSWLRVLVTARTELSVFCRYYCHCY